MDLSEPVKPEEPVYKKKFVRHSRMMSSQSGRAIHDKKMNDEVNEHNAKLKIEYEVALEKYMSAVPKK